MVFHGNKNWQVLLSFHPLPPIIQTIKYRGHFVGKNINTIMIHKFLCTQQKINQWWRRSKHFFRTVQVVAGSKEFHLILFYDFFSVCRLIRLNIGLFITTGQLLLPNGTERQIAKTFYNRKKWKSCDRWQIIKKEGEKIYDRW